MVIEAIPVKGAEKLGQEALYTLTAESTPTSVTIRREMAMGNVLFAAKDYQNLRAFYAKLYNEDQQSIVLTRAAPKPPTPGT